MINLWASLNVRIRDYLALVTLEQLVASPKVKDIAVLQDMRACGQPEEAVLA